MTRSDLKTSTRKELAALAREHRVSGWHDMRKDELVDALDALFKRRRRKRGTNGSHGSGREPSGPRPRPNRNGSPRCRLLPTPSWESAGAQRRDRVEVEARGPYWIYARWTLSPRILDRAEAALGTEWRQAVPVLRIFDETESGTTSAQTRLKDVEISQPIGDWFVPVKRPGRWYRLQLGYRSPGGTFFVLAQSAKVKTPRAGTFPEEADPPRGGASSGRAPREGTGGFRRRDEDAPAIACGSPPPNGRPSARRTPAAGGAGESDFQMDAEVTLYGRAHPAAQLSLMGSPVRQGKDGTFSLRLALEEGRQVIPAECIAPDGCEIRTIVLAIERNTKHLDPVLVDEML